MTTNPFLPSSAPHSTVDFGANSFEQAAQIAGAVSFSDVAQTDVPWLWPGRIPIGRVTLLVGDPGLGKSLVTLDIAARVSRGAAWPDEEAGSMEQGARRKASASQLPAPRSPPP